MQGRGNFFFAIVLLLLLLSVKAALHLVQM
jgi:hypothetical protein